MKQSPIAPKITLHRKQRGASLTGYGLIVGLIAIIAIIAIQSVGDNIRILFGNVGNKMETIASGNSSGGGGSTPAANQAPAAATISSSTIQENNTANDIVGTLSAIDPEGDNITYTLTAGGDNAFFQIAGVGNDELQAIGIFDFETPQDADFQNDYGITITATDNGSPNESSVANLTITITNINEAAWDLTSILFDNKSLSIGTEVSLPTSIFFKPDGMRFYITGSANSTIYQYSLTTAWDISTASYDSVSLSVSAESSDTVGVFFKPDGLRMYMIGSGSDRIYQYNLSTPWDISTAVYASLNIPIGTEDIGPQDLFFSPDGTKAYMVGLSTDSVYQYNLSTPWLISTASYSGSNLSVATEETNPKDVFFKPDGTRLYIVGNANDLVHQYSLTTPWDISTASSDGINHSLTTQDSNPQGIFFRSDGGMLFMIGSISDTIYQYVLN